MEEDRRHDKTSTISQSIRKLKQAASGNAFRHFPPMSEYSQGSPFCRLPRWVSGKESTCRCRRCVLDPWSQKTPWRRKWQPTPVFLPEFPLTEEPGGLQSTGSQESDMTQQLNYHHQHHPQYTCLKNPMDKGTWRAMVHGVAQSQT